MTSKKHWHSQALKLRGEGLSSREIAKRLGKGKSTINDFFTKHFQKLEVINEEIGHPGKKGPRILIYDIETSPIIAHLWSMWQQGIGLKQIETDWFVMSFCAKWLGEDEIFYFDQRDAENMEDDKELCERLWELFNEADFVVGQNVKAFDNKKMNARFILNGLPRPSTYRSIDTLDIAKANFNFTSRKLEYMSKNLCTDTHKDSHSEFPGHELWVECLKGNRKAWEAMERYNRDDVLSTEELYILFSSWDLKQPNFDVYVDEILDMDEWEHDGFHYTQFGKYKRYRNKTTGQQRRSRVNLLPKEKRQSLLANIV